MKIKILILSAIVCFLSLYCTACVAAIEPANKNNIKIIENFDNSFDEIVSLKTISSDLALKKGNKWALYSRAKYKFITNYEYDEIKCLDNSSYLLLKKNNKYALYDIQENKFLTSFEYDDIKFFNDYNFALKKHNKWAIYCTGGYNVEPGFITDFIFEDVQGGVVTFVKLNKKWVLYDNNPVLGTECDEFQELNFASVIVLKKNNKLALYDNRKKDFIIRFECDEIKPLPKWTEYYILKKGEKFALVSNSSEIKFLADFEYDDIQYLDNSSYLLFKKNNKNILFNIVDKKFLADFQYDDIEYLGYKNYAAVKKLGKWAICINYNNNLLTDFEYDEIKHLYLDTFIVRKGNKWALKNLLSKNSNLIYEYDDFKQLSIPFYIFKKNGKWALFKVNEKKFLNDFAYDEIINLHTERDDCFILKKNNKLALFVPKYDILTDFEYDKIFYHEESRYVLLEKAGNLAIYSGGPEGKISALHEADKIFLLLTLKPSNHAIFYCDILNENQTLTFAQKDFILYRLDSRKEYFIEQEKLVIDILTNPNIVASKKFETIMLQLDRYDEKYRNEGKKYYVQPKELQLWGHYTTKHNLGYKEWKAYLY